MNRKLDTKYSESISSVDSEIHIECPKCSKCYKEKQKKLIALRKRKETKRRVRNPKNSEMNVTFLEQQDSKSYSTDSIPDSDDLISDLDTESSDNNTDITDDEFDTDASKKVDTKRFVRRRRPSAAANKKVGALRRIRKRKLAQNRKKNPLPRKAAKRSNSKWKSTGVGGGGGSGGRGVAHKKNEKEEEVKQRKDIVHGEDKKEQPEQSSVSASTQNHGQSSSAKTEAINNIRGKKRKHESTERNSSGADSNREYKHIDPNPEKEPGTETINGFNINTKLSKRTISLINEIHKYKPARDRYHLACEQLRQRIMEEDGKDDSILSDDSFGTYLDIDSEEDDVISFKRLK